MNESEHQTLDAAAAFRLLRALQGGPPMPEEQLAHRLLELACALLPVQEPPAGEWPQRLRRSARQLTRTSVQLQLHLHDPARFGRLTDPNGSSEAAASEVRQFGALVDRALADVIDLSGVDQPDQGYPELAPWFEFRCANVVYGKQRDAVTP